MNRIFAFVGATVIFVFGFVLHISYITSGGTVWSVLISSVNSSAWETLKPFALAYIMWIVIELSYLRPSLLHFVCAKILMLYVFAVLMIVYCLFVRQFVNGIFAEVLFYSGIYAILYVVQLLSYRMFKSPVKTEIFYIPILLSLFLFVFMILLFSVYPPHIIPFYDFKADIYGVGIYKR
ncbi:MAG: DUF6512 family protein [Clostridia bacterium]|nr:DUF6512 family protein [Clostridia bacterium]